MTQLLTVITALDQSKETADQGTLNEIKAQRDLYKRGFFAYAEALKGLEQKKSSLKDRLMIPLNGLSVDSPVAISFDQTPGRNPLSSASESDPILTEIEELDEKNDRLTHKLIAKCTRQRDKYRDGLYQLKDAVIACQKEIAMFEEQLNQQKILSTPKKPMVHS